MKKARVFIINGVPKNAKEIADELKCSVVTVFNFYRDFPGHTDTENFRRLKEKLKKKNFVEGYVPLQSIAQKTHIDKKVIFEFLKSVQEGRFSILIKTTKRNQPLLMLKTVELPQFITELKEFKEFNEDILDEIEEREKEKKEREKIEEVKNLDELKKLHPLVKDERFFVLNYFPKIDSYEVLTECNIPGGYLAEEHIAYMTKELDKCFEKKK